MRLPVTLGTFYKTECTTKMFDTESDPQSEFSLNVIIYTKPADIMKG